MEMRVLGRTDFLVSSVGFGGIPIQRVTQELATDMLREAHKNGINFIDTARGYLISEELIGNALAEIGREHFMLATKTMNRAYEGFLDDVNISLKNLKTHYIDLYQFHNVKNMDQYNELIKENGALDAAKEAKRKGLIKEIGITSHSADVLKVAIETEEFSTIQFPYNAVERQGEEIFKRAKERNIGVIIMKPLAGGAITNGELAIRFILENKNISVVIPGMDSIEQVNENARPGIDGLPLSDEERQLLEKEAKQLGTTFCRRCGYCAPCTVGIDIPVQFVLDSYYTRYNLQQWAIDRYSAQMIKASDCIECGVCEERCPYDLPIIDMLKEVASHY